MDTASTAAVAVKSPSLLDKVEAGLSAFWHKLSDLWNRDVVPVLTEVEAEVLDIFKPLLGQFEASELQIARTFIAGVVAAAPTTRGVAEWEIVIIQLAEVAGGQTWVVIQRMAGTVLQALIALVLNAIVAAQANVAAKAA